MRGLLRLFLKFGLAAVFAAALWAAWKYLPQSRDLGHIYKQWVQERVAARPLAYYPNCAAARAAGAAPMRIGEPGYREELDADRNGVACETPPATAP